MKKGYESPDFEIVRFRLSTDVLGISQGESITSGGGYIPPEEEEEEILNP